MAEGQMLKKIPEECLLNISSFMLGTPQQMKFKNSKRLRQIQKKYKLDKRTLLKVNVSDMMKMMKHTGN